MKRLFVGSTDLSLSIEATKFNSTAVLIKNNTLNELDNITVGYISLGDHSLSDFVKVLEVAPEIYYVPIENNDSLKSRTESWLRYYSTRKKVYNFVPTTPYESDYLRLADSRKSDKSQLWSVGCSFTSALGVSNSDRWGHKLGIKLGIPTSFLAEPGSSISWAADQILRSDIRPGDTVVWLITGASRFPYYDKKVNQITDFYYKYHPEFNKIIPEKILLSDHMKYLAITSISNVIKNSKQIGYNLVLSRLGLDIESNEYFMLDYLHQFEFYLNTYGDGTLLDFGTDLAHPGPKQHQLYADQFFNFIQSKELIYK